MRSAVVLGSSLLVTVAAFADQPHVHPYTQASPSGAWRLSVMPTDPEGKGAATYALARDGARVFEAKLPHTLRECVVTDAGLAIGYAYDTGYMGWGGNLVVCSIDPGGTLKVADTVARDGPAAAVDPPPPGEPRGMGVLLDTVTNRVIVRTAASFDEVPANWLVYDATNGAKRPAVTPPQPTRCGSGFSREIDARVIPDTGLIVVQWMDWRINGQSAVFDVLDASATPVWSRRIDDEYANLGPGWRWWDLLEQQVRQLDVGPSSFSITSYADAKRTDYALARNGDAGWSVAERGSAPATPKATVTAPAALDITPGELNDLGTITLGARHAAPAITGVHSLCFDDRGRIGWVRWDESAAEPSARFVLASREGAVVADHVLKLPPQRSSPLPQCTWLVGERWLITRTVYAENSTSSGEAWFFDANTGVLTRIENLTLGSVECARAFPDASFAILSRAFGDYTIRDGVTRCAPDGKVVTATLEPGYGRGENISDIAVLSDGSLARLVGVALNTAVKIARPGADNDEVLDVAQVLGNNAGAEQSYIADIRADKDGGFILYDSANKNLLHRIDAHGKCWQSFHVTGPKGEPFRLYDAFAVDPDGRVWASDGFRLYRCGPDGKADLALGGPAEGEMAEPVALTLDGESNIYALEAGTAAVHVFSPTGEPTRVMRPDPAAASTQDALAWIAVDPDGTVRTRMGYEAPVVTYSPKGEYVGAEVPSPEWATDRVAKWDPVRGGAWDRDGATLRRLDALGNPVKTIQHRPDGAWIVHVEDADAAPDGSLALVCTEPDPARWLSFGQGPMWLCHYAPDGSPRGTLMLDRTSYTYSVRHLGDRVLLMDNYSILAFEASGPLAPRATRYEIGKEGDVWQVMERPKGELLAWRSGSFELRRLALPASAAP
jgi:hypothetical protein